MIRAFPYPFASALSIVSDVDGSSKARYEGYVGQIVRKHGLDFGDSTWLRTSCETTPGGIPVSYGLGFFSRNFGFGNDDVPRTFLRTRTFIESLVEYHAGNLDHFHAFVNRGPRVAVLEGGTSSANCVEFELADLETQGFWRCGDIYIEMICIILRGPHRPDIAAIAVTERDGRVTKFDCEVPGPETEPNDVALSFAIAGSVDDNPCHPPLDNIANVRVEFAARYDKDRVARVLLVSAPRWILLDRLGVLRDRFNVEMPLVTEHGGQHFRSAGMIARRDSEQDKYITGHPGRIAAFNGSRTTQKDGLVFSIDADEPRSVARVLPEISTEFEVRFLVPQAARSNTGWTADKMVQPLATRAGTVAYQVHRTLPNLNEPEGRALFDGTQSRQENFPDRLDKVLDAASKQPGLFWPIYTHLGGITVAVADQDLPSPYLDGAALHRLQDRTFNISGNVPPEARIWTARGTIFYDFALMRDSISDHVVWTEANTVEIASWRDTVLDKMMPRSPAQLYGLTFYVEDPASARVLLDGRPIPLLARNPADVTGRPSVTIMESEICHPVFDALDPASKAGSGATLVGGAWKFSGARKTTPAYGRLTAAKAAAASLRLPMFGWTAEGAQLLAFLGRRSKGASLGITLETEAGGRFFFGDRAMLEMLAPVTAHYIFEHVKEDGFREMVAPFHCMTWASGSETGGPMPSHPLSAIILHCAGGSVDFGKLRLLRPRATSLNHGAARSYCLIGQVPDFQPYQTVRAQLKGRKSVAITTVDQRGWFCFPKMAPGIYTVWTETGDGKIHDRRGSSIELRSDLITLRLDRKASGANA